MFVGHGRKTKAWLRYEDGKPVRYTLASDGKIWRAELVDSKWSNRKLVKTVPKNISEIEQQANAES